MLPYFLVGDYGLSQSVDHPGHAHEIRATRAALTIASAEPIVIYSDSPTSD
jgi:hypothetical protein